MYINRDCRKLFRGLFNYLIILLAILKAVEIVKTLDNLDNKKISFHQSRQKQNNSNKPKHQKPNSDLLENKQNDHFLLQVSNQSCPTATPDDEIFSAPPKGRVLIAVFPYGPNNQIRGFRETIFLAKMLNRSIVAPPFFKHDRTDKSVSSSSNLIDPWDRIDLAQISSIVPLVDPRKLKDSCGESFDVILRTKRRNNPMSRIEDVYNYSSMNFHSFKQTKRQPSLNSTTLPASGAIKLGTNVTRVRELWTSDEKCAFMLFPYHVINFKGIVNNSKKYAFVDLQREIVRATRRPKYIQEVVEKFFDSEIKEEYGALHWRYDPKDWFLHCDREKNEGPICSGVRNARNNPERFGEKLLEDLQTRSIKVLYIAAPVDDHELISKIILPIKKHLKVFTGKDLEKFIKQNYSSCPKIMKNFHDAFSLLEQEMCFKSRRFYPSTGSSWSLNVEMERIVFDKSENEDNYNLMKNM